MAYGIAIATALAAAFSLARAGISMSQGKSSADEAASELEARTNVIQEEGQRNRDTAERSFRGQERLARQRIGLTQDRMRAEARDLRENREDMLTQRRQAGLSDFNTSGTLGKELEGKQRLIEESRL